MDTDFLHEMIDIVTNKENYDNKYDNFDKLVLTLNEDEINYFLSKCGIHLFYSVELSQILIDTIPIIYKKHILSYTDKLLENFEEEKFKTIELYNNNKLSDNHLNIVISRYKTGTNKIKRFRKEYLELLNKKIKNLCQ